MGSSFRLICHLYILCGRKPKRIGVSLPYSILHSLGIIFVVLLQAPQFSHFRMTLRKFTNPEVNENLGMDHLGDAIDVMLDYIRYTVITIS